MTMELGWRWSWWYTANVTLELSKPWSRSKRNYAFLLVLRDVELIVHRTNIAQRTISTGIERSIKATAVANKDFVPIHESARHMGGCPRLASNVFTAI
jgi:hypothetical protein